MKRRTSFLLAAAFTLMSIAVPAVAHHSFAAQFDRSKPITLNGSVTKLEWINPHARFFIDVKDTAGKVTNWEVELASPNGLMRRGWTRNSLKAGQMITVQGWVAKDGSSVANAQNVTLSDGKKVFAGSSGDDEATK